MVFVPYEKLSKKKQKEIDAQKRRTWGEICPITRKTKNLTVYNRQNEKKIARRDINDSY